MRLIKEIIYIISKADLLIGGVSADVMGYRNLSSSIAYSSDDITWCLASAKQLPRWQNMFRIIPIYLWFIFLFFGYAAIVVLYKLLKYDPGTYHSFHVVTMITLQGVFGLSSHFYPKNGCVRAFYLAVLVVGIVGITTFTAFFIKFLTVPIYMRQVETAEEITSGGYKLCGLNETLSFYNQQNLVCIVL